MKTRLQQLLHARATSPAILLAGMALTLFVFKPGLVFRIMVYFFSGRAFMDERIVTGGSLDQPSLHKGFFLFCVSSVLAAIPVFVARLMSHWQLKPARMWFRVLSFPLFLLPFTILTITSIQLLRYMSAMGLTPMRLVGASFSLAGYIVVLVSLAWSWRSRQTAHNKANL